MGVSLKKSDFFLVGDSEIHDGSDDVTLGLAESLDGLLASAVSLGHDEVDILGGELSVITRGGGGILADESGGILLTEGRSTSSTETGRSGGLGQSGRSLVNLRLSKDNKDLTRGRLEDVGLSNGEDGLLKLS